MSKTLRSSLVLCIVLALTFPASAQVVAIRTGRLLDPARGTAVPNQVILVGKAAGVSNARFLIFDF